MCNDRDQLYSADCRYQMIGQCFHVSQKSLRRVCILI